MHGKLEPETVGMRNPVFGKPMIYKIMVYKFKDRESLNLFLLLGEKCVDRGHDAYSTGFVQIAVSLTPLEVHSQGQARTVSANCCHVPDMAADGPSDSGALDVLSR